MAAPIELAPGVWRIPLFGDWINGFMLRDEDGQVTLVDFGLKRSPPKVVAGLESLGSSTADVTRVILTHAHPDHAGGAAEIARLTNLALGIHGDDAGYLESGKSAPRDPAFALGRLFNRFGSGKFEPAPVSERLEDGQVLPVAGGLQVIHTPGHSPGHVSLLHLPSGVLITGDCIFNVRGVGWSIKAFCTDFAMSKLTAHRLADLEYSVAAFTHGPEIRDRARESIRGFLAEHPA